MSQPLEGQTDSYIIKEVELKEVIGLARYLRRVNLHIWSQLMEFEDILTTTEIELLVRDLN